MTARQVTVRPGFNSRSRGGSDTPRVPTYQDISVSIHAPAGGATWKQPQHEPLAWFQFTLPRGERPAIIGAQREAAQFQFTLPRGERQSSCLRW